ncbi:MAG: 1-hydroxycarotenoid 3,4-desaturase CrtD [Croceivirga sp.]
MPKNAIVIGAGIAGIASAIRLNSQGFSVTVYESNVHPGGKLHQKKLNGFRFDMGPSLFTMPWLVDELFQLCNKNPKDYFRYFRKETICNYFWEDGTQFSAASDQETFCSDASNTFNEPKENIAAYLKKNETKYRLTKSVFLEKSLHKLRTYLSNDTLKAFLRISGMGINQTLDSVNASSFSNPKLIQFFNRFATYNGSSPYQTPGIMSMIPHLEMDLGTYFPEGGMFQITESLYKLAKEVGVSFHFNSPVTEILVSDKKAIGVRVGDININAEVVVSNMDVYHTYTKLLIDQIPPKKTLAQERSSSALIFYWGIKKQFPELDLHNIFFSENYQQEFDHIFNKKSLCDDPTIYVNISSKEEEKDAPKGHENWFVMINAPGNYSQDWEELKLQARKNILSKLSRNLNCAVQELIVDEMVWDPVGIENQTSSYRGALYGAASNSRFAAFLRHPNFSKRIKNLYFCGGSVHPGGGIPLCLLSGKIVGDLVKTNSG